MNFPFFSIIIPVYKVRPDYFDVCIQSVTQQTFSNIEIVLVDDGSPDNCGELCDKYAAKDDRIKVIHQKNQGVSVARNTGVEHSCADWILFVDADDWLELDACERLKTLVTNSDYDILLFRAVKEYADKSKVLNYGFINGKTYNTSNIDMREFLYRRAMQTPNAGKLRVCPVYYSWDKVYKRSFLINNKLLYPKGLPKSEDKVFMLRCFEKLNKLHYVDDVFYHYRINIGSVCNRYSENADADRVMLVRLLGEIAERMDRELGSIKGEAEYNLITKDYKRFVFGIITDVLFLKYYHPDYPYGKRKRVIEAKNFINTEPFKSSIQECNYRELSFEAKLKKLLLSLGLITLFCNIRYVYKKLMKNTAEE